MPLIRAGLARRHMVPAALGAAMLGALLASGLYAMPTAGGGVVGRTAVRLAQPVAVSPVPLREVAPEEALRLNAAIPMASGPNPAAAPLSAAGLAPGDRARALECLASAVYYEAATESPDGQRAVAQVVLNRVRHSAFPASVCGVVFEGSERETGCQFSFTCDGSLARRPSADGWKRAWKVAEAALSGQVFAPVGLATHYHANYVRPYWAPSLAKNAVVGTHIFYRWPGQWGRSAAFGRSYTGGELDPARLRLAALQAEMQFAEARGGPALTSGDLDPSGQGRPSTAEQAVAVDVELRLARATLGPKHPRMIELKKQESALGRNRGGSRAAQLAAVETQLKAAARTLGPKHPQMVALLKQRDALALASN